MVPIAVLITLLIGGGTSIAAEQALPGDMLYPIKVEVNENVRSALAISSEAQATWDARRAERRLEEAERLATQDQLNTETRAMIESNLDEHLQSFDAEIAKLEARSGHEAAAEVESDLEASLRAHETVLDALESGTAQQEVDALLAIVSAKADNVASVRMTAEAHVPADGTIASLKAAAEGKMTATENKIAEVKKYLENKASTADAGVLAEAQIKLAASEDALARGKTQTTAEAYADAAVSFREANRLAQEAQVLVATGDRVDLKTSGADMNASFSKQDDDDADEMENEEEDGSESDDADDEADEDSNGDAAPGASGGGELRVRTHLEDADDGSSSEAGGGIHANLGL